jgi:hypothetical protein
MSIIVLTIDDVWQEWHGDQAVRQMLSNYTAVYGDGRQVDTPCDPYPVEKHLDGGRVLSFYDHGIWSIEEIEALGAKIAVPFEVPEGKQIVGPPEYVEQPDGSVAQVYQVEDIPPPPAPPTQEEKVTAMVSNSDLTIAELKSVLGIG